MTRPDSLAASATAIGQTLKTFTRDNAICDANNGGGENNGGGGGGNGGGGTSGGAVVTKDHAARARSGHR